VKLFEPLSRDAGAVRARLLDNNFDALRLTFASMVVLFHIGLLSAAPALGLLRGYISATFAVQAFFVVSGFLVTMSFENSSSVRSYALKRLRRIAPAYVTVVLGAAVALVLLSTLSPRAYFAAADFRQYVVYNLMLSNFRAPSLPGVFQSNPVTAVNGSLWTIKIEVAFYIAVPLIVWAVRRFGYRPVLAAVFVASLAWRVGLDALSPLPGGDDIYAKLAKQLPGQLAFFAGGAWAYYAARQGRGPGIWPAIAGAIAYALSSGLIHEALEPFAVTAIVSWAALAAPRLPQVGKHGDFSYGVYLYHFPIVQTCVALGLFAWSAGAAVLIVAILVLLCSVLSWYLVESPALARRASGVHGARRSLAS
jgi:peptidoglycan/LPS O-acetylase OafA/YrhL